MDLTNPTAPLIGGKSKCILAAVTAATLLAILLPGCDTVQSRIDATIVARLPKLLGPADHYEVRTSGNIFELMRGKLRSARIHGENVALTPQLHVRSFDAIAHDIHADRHNEVITGIGATTFHLAMDQSDLNNYLLAARPAGYRQRALITLGPDTITYSGSVRFWGVRAPFSVTGVLTPHPGDDSRLDFVPARGAFARVGLPITLVKIAVSRQNPVASLSGMRYPVAVYSTHVIGGALIVDGTVDLTSLIGKSIGA